MEEWDEDRFEEWREKEGLKKDLSRLNACNCPSTEPAPGSSTAATGAFEICGRDKSMLLSYIHITSASGPVSASRSPSLSITSRGKVLRDRFDARNGSRL